MDDRIREKHKKVLAEYRKLVEGCLRSIGTDHNEEQVYIGAQEGTVYAYLPPQGEARTTDAK